MKLSRFIPVVLLVALFSCKKNDDKATPTVPDPVYLPASLTLSASDSSAMKYSFAYNSDSSLATINVSGGLVSGNSTIKLVRNANGDCVKLTFTDDQGITSGAFDSVAYRSNGMTVFIFDGFGTINDSAVFSFNSQGDIISFGSKDTITNQYNKFFEYTELSFVNGNPETINTYSYSAPIGAGQGSTNNYTSTYSYDNKPNGFQPLFRKDPVLVYFMSNVLAYVSLGKNNLTAIKQSGLEFTFTNTYDDVTGYLSTQKTSVQISETQSIALTMTYTYIQPK